MRIIFLLCFCFFNIITSFGQSDTTAVKKQIKAPINLYKYYNLNNDTLVVDTSLTIQDDYSHNYLKQDLFGLQSFANENHIYSKLDLKHTKYSFVPSFGFKAKNISFISAEEVYYYHVPTPLTELYFKTVFRQGQSADAFVTVNTKPNLNFSIGYKSLRSVGDYFNDLSSAGYLRFTSSYYTPSKRYFLNAHFVSQDKLNYEFGGIINLSQFEDDDPSLKQRERIDVFFSDAKSRSKLSRYFIDQRFKINRSFPLFIKHQLNYEYQFFEFNQSTISSRLGNSQYSNIIDKVRNEMLLNQLGVNFDSNKLGNIFFGASTVNSNQFYLDKLNDAFNDKLLNNNILLQSVVFNYVNTFKKFNIKVNAQSALNVKNNNEVNTTISYPFTDKEKVNVGLQYITSLPSQTMQFFQSGYDNYNWINGFKNQTTTTFVGNIQTRWINAELELRNYKDYLYFYNTNESIDSLVVKPFQYSKTIQYFGAKFYKELNWRNWCFDNTLKYQKVTQNEKVLNLPDFILRSSLYFSKPVFKKAMLLQTGVTANYFSSYFADGYNPLIGDYYTQREFKIGNYPLLDFFVNARVRQCRIFLKAEHFNALFTEKNYYSAPNYPFRDFKIRFGISWNMFQ